MKLKKGQTVCVGKEKFTDYIPDEKAIALGLKKSEYKKPIQKDSDK